MTNQNTSPSISRRHFRDLPISAKLNIVLIAAIVCVLGIAGTAISYWLGHKLEQRSMAEMHRINRQVIDMIDAYASVLENSAEAQGASFAATLPRHLSADANALTATGDGSFPTLHGGGVTLNNNVALTDAFTATTGAVATIFVRQGDDFIRVATSLKKQDGQRAQGTPLGKAHPAYAKVTTGERYVGRASLFGRDYATCYIPLKDESGKVVGIAFVGIDFSEGLKELKKKILSIKIGDTGYVFALETKSEPGKAVIHPAAEGKNLIDVKASDGRLIAKEMITQGNGELHYLWTNTKDGVADTREKITVFETYERWGWLVATGSYLDEFQREVRTLQLQEAVAGVVIVLLLAGAIYYATRRWIDAPLNEAVTAVHRVANGDFTVTVHEMSHDEVGQLMKATNQMCGQLRTMIGEVGDGIGRLSANAQQLAAASHTVAEGSAQQSVAASTMAADVEEMSASIGTVSSNAQEARTMAEKSGEISENGAAIISQAIGSMNSISATVTHSSQTVGQLGVQSQEINGIVEVIREIADQTNLLALNAAIEAARAGEQGRGFAVVADEVRQLAERTTKSTQEITAMVQKIQTDAKAAVESMDQGVAEVEHGVGLANEAGTSIASIKSGAAHVGRAVVSISDALREQTTTSGEISNLVARIADQAEENHVMAQQTSASAADMEQLAKQLRTSISRFKI